MKGINMLTDKERALLELLDVAITYIEQIADKDSPTLDYIKEHYDNLANEGE